MEEKFCCLCNENKAICSFCELHKVGYFVVRDSWRKPIAWELHKIYLFSSQSFNFYVKIDLTVRFDYLIQKIGFFSCKIVKFQLPKGKKLTKEQKSMLSKMYVRFYFIFSCK